MAFIILLLLALVFFLISAFSFIGPFTLLPAFFCLAAALAVQSRASMRGWIMLMGLAGVLWLLLIGLALFPGG